MSIADPVGPPAGSARADLPNPALSLPFPVVGLGASSGGLGALRRFFEQMPADSGMAFVVVLHLSPDHDSSAAAILQRATRAPVIEVRQPVDVRKNHVYVISPALGLRMADGQLLVDDSDRPRGRAVAIDFFFRTLADAHRERAVSVVLSGNGSDGTVGMTRIKEQGGVALVQSPDDAEFDAMPRSAIATGMADFVLPVTEMPQKLIDLWDNARRIVLPQGESLMPGIVHETPPEALGTTEAALRDILALLQTRTGHDFSHFKRASLLRRLERRLQVCQLPDLPAYLAYLQTRLSETDSLLRDVLVGVTNFFRDREAFEALERAIVETVFSDTRPRGEVRVWVAGCATGEEAYSVAMLLHEQSRALRRASVLQVLASDIDARAVDTARHGAYPASIAADVSPRRLRQFFTADGEQYRVNKALRDDVVFAMHDLLRDPPFSRMDIVCCRNLLMLLDRETQARVLGLLHYALQPGGLLFLGASESTEAAEALFTPVDKQHRIYQANGLKRAAPPAPIMSPRPTTLLSLQPSLPNPEPPPLAQLHQRLIDAHGPASVLVDADANILHLSPGATRHVRYVGGPPSHNLVVAVHDELRLALRTALSLALREGRSVEARQVPLQRGGRTTRLNMAVHPVRDPASGATFLLVLFSEVEASLAAAGEGEAGPVEGRDAVQAELETELQRTRELLQGSLGASRVSSEELRASNEELQAINEELRSATEELQTSKEELQSVNEELVTVNQELKDRVEETGKANDDLLNLISASDIAAVFVDHGMVLTRFTPRATEIFNLRDTDLGRSLLDITHQLDDDGLEHDVEQALRSLQVHERELAGRGGKTWRLRVQPYRTQENRIDGAVLSFFDISATRQAEAALREGELHMQLVAESMRDYAIVTFDLEGRVTSWNTGAALLFGYSADEMLGQAADRLFTPEDRAAGVPQAELRQARDEGRATSERWQLRKDGSRFFCSGILGALRDGQPRGYARIARDLTQLKLAEAEREARLTTEQALREALQAASTSRDEFLAVMSHELKHPLNLIHVNAELLSRMPEARSLPNVTRAADLIRLTVMSQAKVIDDLLDLSRLNTGKLSLEREPMDWLQVIDRVCDAMLGDARARQLSLERQLDPAAAMVRADAARVEQIVWNLLSNAVKFTPAGGSIRVVLSLEGSRARLDVSDSGQGIEPNFLPHVFEMFRQADSRSTRQQGGLGIGLALVRQLSELMGGAVAVASTGRGQGARFTVWLPRSGLAQASRQDDERGAPLAGLRLLLVDDTTDTLESFALLLRVEGAIVSVAGSGKEALALVDADAGAQAAFDLVLSDVGMPGMDGHQLVQALRRRSHMAHVPAIALTGFGQPGDKERALDAGFDAHLTKPVGLAALLPLVLRLVPPRDAG